METFSRDRGEFERLFRVQAIWQSVFNLDTPRAGRSKKIGVAIERTSNLEVLQDERVSQ